MDKVRYYTRIGGELFRITPITRATDNNPSVKAFIVRTGKVQRILWADIIIDY